MRKPLNLTGKTYGKLTAIKIHKRDRKRVIWECLCDCGETTYVETSKLKNQKTKSCGCLRRKRRNLEGKRYGKLVVEKLDRVDKYCFWKCRCDCGNYTIVSSTNLNERPEGTKSCGCSRIKNSSIDILYRQYSNKASGRGLDFELNKTDFTKLVTQNCYYCNSEPSNLFNNRIKTIKNNTFLYNGIDRKDNNQGYTKSNTVSSCKWCNYAKRERSMVDFINWVKKLNLNILREDLDR